MVGAYVYIGSFGTKGVNGIHPGIPENLFESIETAVKQTKFNNKFNWIRTYAGIFEDSTVLEALHNNEDWIEGSNALETVDWLKSDGFYSIRNFLIATEDS